MKFLRSIVLVVLGLLVGTTLALGIAGLYLIELVIKHDRREAQPQHW